MCHDFEICTNAFNGWCMLYVKIEELKKKGSTAPQSGWIFIYKFGREVWALVLILYSNGLLICIQSSQLELLRFGRRAFHGNVARGTKPNRIKINSFHATYKHMYVHIHIARMCICSISLIWSAFPTEHLFYILDKLIIITLSNFTLSKFFSPASNAIKFLFFRLILMDLPTVF